MEAFWDAVHHAKPTTETSWYQPTPAVALELIDRLPLDRDAPVIDVGGGASTLVDSLLDRGFTDVSVLDVSPVGLAVARRRLAGRAGDVEWIAADVTEWQPGRRYALWHDRAVFHFLTEPADRARYVATARTAVRPHGHAIVATFALDGPEECSGLAVARYSPATLAAAFGEDFALVAERHEGHRTPWGAVQPFSWAVLERR